MKSLIAATVLAALVATPALARKANHHHARGHRAHAATVVYGSAYGPYGGGGGYRTYGWGTYRGWSRNFQDSIQPY